jgi:hypothetical protein
MRFLAPRRPLALGMMLPSKGHKNWMFNFSVIGSRRKGVPEGFLATAKNGHLECNTNMQLYKVFVLHSTSHRCQPHVRHVRMSSERPAMFSRLKAAGWCSHVGAATSSWRLLPCSLDATPGFHWGNGGHGSEAKLQPAQLTAKVGQGVVDVADISWEPPLLSPSIPPFHQNGFFWKKGPLNPSVNQD